MWQDTVMSKEQAMKYYVTDSELATGLRCAKAQAEISFKAGRESLAQEVADWIEKYLVPKLKGGANVRVVYISGAYRDGSINGIFENIIKARSVAIKLWQENWAVICPHLNSFLMDGICNDDVWLRGDLEILKRCDAIFMLDGFKSSEGAMAELEMALKWGLKVYYESNWAYYKKEGK